MTETKRQATQELAAELDAREKEVEAQRAQIKAMQREVGGIEDVAVSWMNLARAAEADRAKMRARAENAEQERDGTVRAFRDLCAELAPEGAAKAELQARIAVWRKDHAAMEELRLRKVKQVLSDHQGRWGALQDASDYGLEGWEDDQVREDPADAILSLRGPY